MIRSYILCNRRILESLLEPLISLALRFVVDLLDDGKPLERLGVDLPLVADRAGVIGGTPGSKVASAAVALDLGDSECTGSLWRPRIIITAAHCVSDSEGVEPDVLPGDVRVYAPGADKRNGPTTVQVTQILFDPDWTAESEDDEPSEREMRVRREAVQALGSAGSGGRPRALDHVLGYTCANDVSARDWQRNGGGGQWCQGKGFDTFCPLGPWIATGLDPAGLRITCAVGDDLRQDSTTSLMVRDVATLVAWVSAVMTLLPGDVILTGTPAGVGPLADGDVVQVSIDGIGTLENRVISG